MEVIYSSQALQDIDYWRKSGFGQLQLRISALIKAIISSPYHGIGKPEPLKYNLSGYWSRRITKVDRLIYKIDNGVLYIYSLKGHYL